MWLSVLTRRHNHLEGLHAEPHPGPMTSESLHRGPKHEILKLLS